MLQLFPYGWTWQDIKTPCREELTLHMVLAARCTYTRWTNKRPENAFLRKCGSTDKFFQSTLVLPILKLRGSRPI